MRIITTSLLIGSLFLLLTSCGPTPKQAVDYNDSIIIEQIAIVDAIDIVDASFEDYVPSEMDKALKNALNITEDAINKVKAKDDFDGSDEFKKNAIKLFETYKAVLENEFAEMIEIYKLPDDQYTDNESDKWEQLYDEAYAKMGEGLTSFNIYQEQFSTKYSFRLEDKELKE